MLGVIIAAGRGSRMAPLTNECPKSLLPLGRFGKTMFDNTCANMLNVGCDEVTVITGHVAESFGPYANKKVKLLKNSAYKTNNILHSLMTARDLFSEELIVAYSDIWVEPELFERQVASDAAYSMMVDIEWMDYYKGRSLHPYSEAEKVFFDQNKAVVAAGKHLPNCHPQLGTGEFLGLMRLSKTASERWRRAFDSLDEQLCATEAFQNATEWQKAYITDFIQYLVDTGEHIEVVTCKKGWVELDTLQDLERLEVLARTQKLSSFLG